MSGTILRVSGLLLAAALIAIPTAISQQAPAPPAAQEPIDEDSIIKVDVGLVNVLATVRNKNGGLLADLEKSDFRLFENGKEQEIRYFDRQTDLPLTIGLLVDTSGSMENLIEIERVAAAQFFQKVLNDKDLAFILGFGKDSELLQDLTNSQRSLQDGLRSIRLNVAVQPRMGPLGNPGPVPTINNAAGTVLYDAVYLASREVLRQEVGRKALLIISDGADYGSKVTRDAAIEAAHKTDAVIYGIFYSDPRYGSDKGSLNRMAEETGGRVFEVGRKTSLEDIFSQIEQEMRSQYAIAYSPTNPTRDGSYRKIEFKMSNKDYKVQARKGYYAVETEY